ncbi:MAG: hypothetical protein ACJ763_17950 [Bdellovibrionia bacterium]
MRNALFGLFSLLAVIGTHASASPAHDSTQLASLLSFKFPRYEQLKMLPPEAQKTVIEGIQAFLIQADLEARKGGQESALNDLNTLKRFYELWIETAEAKPRSRSSSKSSLKSSGVQQPYCINQGVVKPISECDTSLGYKMHDFDTNKVLSKLGPASQCPPGQMPCSPFFGFTSEGQMFCSSKNLTRDCAEQSKQPGTVSIVNVMMSCQAGSAGVAKVDCKALGEFFDQQMEVVEKLCQKAPKRFACGILKDQIRDVMNEGSEKKSAAKEVGLDKVAEVVRATNEAAQMDAGSAPCPTQEKAKAKSAPAPAAKPKEAQAACTQKSSAKNFEKPTLDALIAELMGEHADDFVCGELTLPNKSKIGLNRMKGEMTVQATPDSTPVTLDFVEAQLLGNISAALLDPPQKVPPKDLLAHYLPKEIMKDPGKIVLESKDGKQKKEFPSKGWITANGTRIRYIPGVDFGDEKKHIVMMSVQLPGSAKEMRIGIPLSLPEDGQEEPANDSKALPSQPE